MCEPKGARTETLPTKTTERTGTQVCAIQV